MSCVYVVKWWGKWKSKVILVSNFFYWNNWLVRLVVNSGGEKFNVVFLCYKWWVRNR